MYVLYSVDEQLCVGVLQNYARDTLKEVLGWYGLQEQAAPSTALPTEDDRCLLVGGPSTPSTSRCSSVSAGEEAGTANGEAGAGLLRTGATAGGEAPLDLTNGGPGGSLQDAGTTGQTGQWIDSQAV